MMSHESEDWTAEVNRAINDHDPSLEPYASMTREELLVLMEDTTLPVYEYEKLHQHLLDRFSSKELDKDNFVQELAMWFMDKRGTHGMEQMMFCQTVALEAMSRIFDDMPAPGPLHEIN